MPSSKAWRIIETAMGLSLVATGIALLWLRDPPEWFVLVLVGAGSFFVSKSLVSELLRQVMEFVRVWRHG